MVLAMSLVLTALIEHTAMTSMWCFFAAILSGADLGRGRSFGVRESRSAARGVYPEERTDIGLASLTSSPVIPRHALERKRRQGAKRRGIWTLVVTASAHIAMLWMTSVWSDATDDVRHLRRAQS